MKIAIAPLHTTALFLAPFCSIGGSPGLVVRERD
jgi:hypothetical protein